VGGYSEGCRTSGLGGLEYPFLKLNIYANTIAPWRGAICFCLRNRSGPVSWQEDRPFFIS